MRLETITVTREDIAQGKKDNCGKCPVAIAIGRYFESVASADLDAIWVSGVGTFHTPRKVHDFMNRFDYQRPGSRPLRPFSFPLWRI